MTACSERVLSNLSLYYCCSSWTSLSSSYSWVFSLLLKLCSLCSLTNGLYRGGTYLSLVVQLLDLEFLHHLDQLLVLVQVGVEGADGAFVETVLTVQVDDLLFHSDLLVVHLVYHGLELDYLVVLLLHLLHQLLILLLQETLVFLETVHLGD